MVPQVATGLPENSFAKSDRIRSRNHNYWKAKKDIETNIQKPIHFAGPTIANSENATSQQTIKSISNPDRKTTKKGAGGKGEALR